MQTIFLLSPASCAGKRAQMLLRNEAAFPLAQSLRAEGVALGAAFSFLSGLYFRGKLAYATTFGRAPAGVGAVHIITTNRGLLSPETIVRHADLCAFGTVQIDATDPLYAAPLVRDARALRDAIAGGDASERRDAIALAAAAPAARIVLLGSVASDKYVNVLLDVFGDALLFPREFVGRGDMSRGGLLLRQVDEGTELEYVSVAGTVRRGRRPVKLVPRKPPG